MKHLFPWAAVLICIYLIPSPLYALTVEEIIRLKEAGVDDRTILILMEKERVKQEGPQGMGVQEKEKPNSGKDKIYYSTTTAEEEQKIQQEEKEKLEKAYEILRNIIIDQRAK